MFVNLIVQLELVDKVSLSLQVASHAFQSNHRALSRPPKQRPRIDTSYCRRIQQLSSRELFPCVQERSEWARPSRLPTQATPEQRQDILALLSMVTASMESPAETFQVIVLSTIVMNARHHETRCGLPSPP